MDTIPSTPHAELGSSEPPKRRKFAFSFRNPLILAAALVVAAGIGVGGGYLLWGRDVAPQTPEVAETETYYRFDISLDDDPSKGPPDAPITIVEFADFTCGFCKKFHDETLNQLLDAYPNKIHYVYRDLPIVGGGQVGYLAAQAAGCADTQGAYWDYHDLLFSGTLGLDRDSLLQYAQDLDLDVEKFTTCLDGEEQSEEVIADARYAYSLGITGTPLFFVNGIRVDGAQPYELFVQLIEEDLNP